MMMFYMIFTCFSGPRIELNSVANDHRSAQNVMLTGILFQYTVAATVTSLPPDHFNIVVLVVISCHNNQSLQLFKEVLQRLLFTP